MYVARRCLIVPGGRRPVRLSLVLAAALPEAGMHVHAAAGLIGKGLGHHREDLAVPLGQRVRGQLEQHHAVVIEGEGNAAKVTGTNGAVLFDSENGAFITVVRDGLERARRVHRIEGNPAVVITRYESGRMALNDPATGWSMELGSFGQGNRAHFDRLFAKK